MIWGMCGISANCGGFWQYKHHFIQISIGGIQHNMILDSLFFFFQRKKKKKNNATDCKTGLMPQASIFCGTVNTKMPC